MVKVHKIESASYTYHSVDAILIISIIQNKVMEPCKSAGVFFKNQNFLNPQLATAYLVSLNCQSLSLDLNLGRPSLALGLGPETPESWSGSSTSKFYSQSGS